MTFTIPTQELVFLFGFVSGAATIIAVFLVWFVHEMGK